MLLGQLQQLHSCSCLEHELLRPQTLAGWLVRPVRLLRLARSVQHVSILRAARLCCGNGLHRQCRVTHLPFFCRDLPACLLPPAAVTVLLLVVLGGATGRTGGIPPKMPGTLPRPGDELAECGGGWP
jgi:hypothetical protein